MKASIRFALAGRADSVRQVAALIEAGRVIEGGDPFTYAHIDPHPVGIHALHGDALMDAQAPRFLPRESAVCWRLPWMGATSCRATR